MNKPTFTTALLPMMVALALSPTAVMAGNQNGGIAIVDSTSPVEDWRLYNGAELIVRDGGATGKVEADKGTRVTFRNGSLHDTAGHTGLIIRSAIGELYDSRIVSDTGRGLALAVVRMPSTPDVPSQLTAERTYIQGKGMGIGAWAGATADLSASELVGVDNGLAGFYDGGIGYISYGSHATFRDGTQVTGDKHGLLIVENDYLVGPGEIETGATFVVDGSRVVGRNDSAIVVANAPDGDTPIDTNADITLRNGAQLTGGNGVMLDVRDTATANVHVADSQLRGDIRVESGAFAHIDMTRSALQGQLQNISSLSLAQSQWALTGDSQVGTLALGGGSEITMGDGSIFHTLDVRGDFSSDGGTILFNTALAGDDSASDRLVIGGSTSGQANVRVNNVGGAGAVTDQGIELISVAGASHGQFDLAGRAVGGQYEYFLFKGTDNGNWYLRSELPVVPDPCVADPTLPGCTPVDPGPGPAPDPDPTPDPAPDPQPVLRPEAGAYLANLQAAQSMFRIGYHDRHAGQNSGRAWARVDGARTGFDAVSRQLDIRGNSQALSVGADVWRAEGGSRVGVMLSSGNASSTSTNALTGYYARGKVKGEALGVYGTWRGGNALDPYAGFYVDGSVQRAQFRNRVEGLGLVGERYDSRVWQGAVETGYAFRVGGAANGSVFLEPQLQLGYNRWDDVRHAESNGTVVTTEDADGLFGRVGLRLSGVTRWGNGAAQVQPYLAAHWLHTRAESQVSMDDERVDARIPRSRGEFSGGASVKFANGIGAWGGLSLQRASGYHQTSVQLGLSYSW